MFATHRVRLRPVTPDDAPGMYEIDSDPENRLIADNRPFIPQSLPAVKAALERSLAEPADGSNFVEFAAETTSDNTLIGMGVLWNIDTFNRFGHLGVNLLPAVRGHGYGRDVIRLLCLYGFRSRNLRRLELETLASNRPMRSVAEACGFTHEGTQREREYDGNGYGDIAIYGLLRSEWKG